MITSNNTTISAYQSDSTSTSTFAIPYGIKVEDNMESRMKGISLCTSLAPVHSSYSCPLSVASEATQKVHLNAKFQFNIAFVVYQLIYLFTYFFR